MVTDTPFYNSLLTFLESKGITPIVLLRDIKTVGYYNVSEFVLIPESLTVDAVWNGYIYDFTFGLIAATKDEVTFRTMLSNTQRLIGTNLVGSEVVIIYSLEQTLDTAVRGFYRENYRLKAKFFVPFT